MTSLARYSRLSLCEASAVGGNGDVSRFKPHRVLKSASNYGAFICGALLPFTAFIIAAAQHAHCFYALMNKSDLRSVECKYTEKRLFLNTGQTQ